MDADLDIAPFTLLEAANAADDPVAARRYSQLMQAEAKHVEVSTPEDVEEMERLASEDGAVQGRFADRDAIQAFVEHQSRQAEAFDTLASSDMAPLRVYRAAPLEFLAIRDPRLRAERRHPVPRCLRRPRPMAVGGHAPALWAR